MAAPESNGLLRLPGPPRLAAVSRRTRPGTIEGENPAPTPDGDVAVSLAATTHAEAAPAESGHRWKPAIDISKDNASLVIEVDLPGLDPNEIDVEIEGDVLHIGGTAGTDRPHGATYVTERKSGQFERNLTLPKGTDPSRVDARYDNGVLTVTVALQEPAAASTRQATNRVNNTSGRRKPGLTPIRITH